MVEDIEQVTKLQVLPVREANGGVPIPWLPSSPPPSLSRQSSMDRFQQPVTIHSIIAETTNDVRTHSPFISSQIRLSREFRGTTVWKSSFENI